MRAVKLEDDSDYHLVISDPKTGGTMIVELIHPDCVAEGGSNPRPLFLHARQAFAAACGTPATGFRGANGSARVTGVGFFDFIHGQTGVAPNGIELHPVLDFEGRCQSE